MLLTVTGCTPNPGVHAWSPEPTWVASPPAEVFGFGNVRLHNNGSRHQWVWLQAGESGLTVESATVGGEPFPTPEFVAYIDIRGEPGLAMWDGVYRIVDANGVRTRPIDLSRFDSASEPFVDGDRVFGITADRDTLLLLSAQVGGSEFSTRRIDIPAPGLPWRAAISSSPVEGPSRLLVSLGWQEPNGGVGYSVFEISDPLGDARSTKLGGGSLPDKIMALAGVSCTDGRTNVYVEGGDGQWTLLRDGEPILNLPDLAGSISMAVNCGETPAIAWYRHPGEVNIYSAEGSWIVRYPVEACEHGVGFVHGLAETTSGLSLAMTGCGEGVSLVQVGFH